MKEILLYIAVLSMVLLISCDKGIEVPYDNSADIKSAKAKFSAEISTEMLSFASVEEMEKQIGELISMDESAILAFNKKNNFISQKALLASAIEEINAVTSIEEANAFKEKYSAVFMFNDNPADEELYNPYLPVDKFGYSLVLNPQGDVMIGGKVMNFNNLKSVKETAFYKSEHNIVSRATTYDQSVNYLKITTKNAKMWAQIEVGNGSIAYTNGVFIDFSSHHKIWLGWTKCQNNYQVKYGSCNFNTWRDADMFQYLRGAVSSIDPDPYFRTGKVASHTTKLIGAVDNGVVATGSLRISSDRTGWNDMGILSIAAAR